MTNVLTFVVLRQNRSCVLDQIWWLNATWMHQWWWDILLNKMIPLEELRDNFISPSVTSQWAFVKFHACAVKWI